jgi:plasmid stabilization system protein ParE
MRILWSPQSLRDLDAIHEYIAKDSEHYAGLTIARIFSAVEQLIEFPTRDALCRREMSLKFAKSSLDVFAWCIGFKIS